MPPPMKNMITSEHEGILWNSRHLSTDTSIGLIQAVIFYLIKCFGLWQGKDLKLLKTEHVTFCEDEMGKFVAIDIKKALGSGKVIKRYDDPGNPRSVYKILKTYMGYLANEGPFLVRPISSIKDYICYSPWPLGLNIIEQTVVNLMQECGIGSGFGNVSVCLMAIDILKSFGAGSHCISTWMLRLYPRYKKTFWADTFKECSTLNCEEKSEEACLVISHLLDPPYPATTLLVEMRRKQEMMRNKSEAMSAWRTSVFNSWLSNINSTSEDMDIGNKTQPQGAKVIKKGSKEALKNAAKVSGKTPCRTEKIKKNVRISNEDKIHLDSSSSSSLQSSSNITVKAEIMSDVDSMENHSTNSNVKIMTVLSIPESAFSAQVDEGESMASQSDNLDDTSSVDYVSKTTSCHVKSSSKYKVKGFKRKLKPGNSCGTVSYPEAKHAKMGRESDCTDRLSPANIDMISVSGSHEVVDGSHRVDSGVASEAHKIDGAADIEMDKVLESICTKIKCEQENECDSSIEMMCDDSEMNIHDIVNDKDKTYSDAVKEEIDKDDPNNCDQTPDEGTNIKKSDLYQNSLTDPEKESNKKPSQSHKVQHEQFKDNSLPTELDTETLVIQSENSQFVGVLKQGKMITQLSSSSLSASSLLGASNNRVPDKTKDSIEILRKLLQQGGKSAKTEAATDDLEIDSEHLSATVDQDSVAHVSDMRVSVGQRDTKSDLRSDKVVSYCRSQDGSKLSCTTSSKRNCNKSLSPSTPTSVTKDIQPKKEEIATKSQENCSNDFQPATDIVHFLNAAKAQLQSILQASSLDSLEDFKEPQHTAKTTKPKQANYSKVNESCSSKPLQKTRGQELLTKQKYTSPAKTNSSDFVSPLTGFNDCSNTGRVTQTKPDKPQPQNASVSNKEEFFPLLRSVLERPKSPLPGISSPSPKATCLKLRSAKRRKRFPPFRLKTPLSGQTQHKLNKNRFHSKNRQRHKHLGQIGPGCKLGDLKCIKNCKLTTTSSPTAHRQSLTNPCPPSLLKQESSGSTSNSGIYYYRSNHKENAAYQSLQITRENQRTQTFTMCDLPLDVPESRSQSSFLNSTTSEICLGDYFPEGTLVPIKDMKLLTRQGCNGLEVMLKFEYKLPDVIQIAHTRDQNEMESTDELKDNSAKNNKDIVDS